MPADLDSLYARGVIGGDQMEKLRALARLAPNLFGGNAQPSFADRAALVGAPPSGNVEDRRGAPESGYEHMLAGNQLIHGLMRAIIGKEPFGDYPVKYARRPTGGQLQKDAGSDDIGRK